MANWADNFGAMWVKLWDLLIYPILALFGIVKNAEGNLEIVETTKAAE